MSSYKHKSGATKRKEKYKKEDQGKAKLSKLDGYFFRPTPPPAGDEPEVVATASCVSSPSPSPPTTLVGLGRLSYFLFCLSAVVMMIIGTTQQLLAARLEESQAWRLTSRTPPPPAPYLLRRKVKKYRTLGMKAATRYAYG
ncbi:hypothetical protein KUCAC02_021353 [Chaenocephalus aceratus]|uniref:Uncharacterized protein n=1 Tax=Chaenocephalus aceratus TaxID=36190 RepID=A0ACB9XGI3_CHAAC|nr:hypothetical protein KUCAC02_021353 [Chaenocephalus aceratus]